MRHDKTVIERSRGFFAQAHEERRARTGEFPQTEHRKTLKCNFEKRQKRERQNGRDDTSKRRKTDGRDDLDPAEFNILGQFQKQYDDDRGHCGRDPREQQTDTRAYLACNKRGNGSADKTNDQRKQRSVFRIERLKFTQINIDRKHDDAKHYVKKHRLSAFKEEDAQHREQPDGTKVHVYIFSQHVVDHQRYGQRAKYQNRIGGMFHKFGIFEQRINKDNRIKKQRAAAHGDQVGSRVCGFVEIMHPIRTVRHQKHDQQKADQDRVTDKKYANACGDRALIHLASDLFCFDFFAHFFSPLLPLTASFS